jgi:type IV/VI secretion system ImpK/VasF family protein
MNLFDITIDLFAYLMAFRIRVKGGIKTTLEDVQKDLLQIFREQEMKVRQNPAITSAYDQVRYPLVVFADEVILNSNWEYAQEWEQELLEKRFFETEVGGDRFFELCEEPAVTNPDVASIFYTCLLMGFRGRYEPESEQLRLLKHNIQEKCPHPGKEQQELLCPDAYNVRERKGQKLPSILRWRQIAILLIVLLGILVILDRVIIWDHLTEPVKSISHIAAARLATGELPPPVPLRAKLSQQTPQRPKSISKSKVAHSDLVTPTSGTGGEAKPEPVSNKKVTKKTDHRSHKPEISREKVKKARPVATKKKPKSTSGYTLQVGAFQSKKNAEARVQVLKERGYNPYMVVKTVSSGTRWYLVHMGHYKVGEAKRARKEAAEFSKKEKIEAFVINRVH